jgi:hypothetical protein
VCIPERERERERERHTGFFFAASGAFTPLLGACRQHKNKLVNQNWEKKLQEYKLFNENFIDTPFQYLRGIKSNNSNNTEKSSRT